MLALIKEGSSDDVFGTNKLPKESVSKEFEPKAIEPIPEVEPVKPKYNAMRSLGSDEMDL
jgi:hypothetical protein